jgi:hypothetical protein
MKSHPPVSLTDHQLTVVMQAARSLPLEKRETYLTRVAGALSRPDARRYRHPDNSDVQNAVNAALACLWHQKHTARTVLGSR